MASLQEQFNTAADLVKKLAKKPTDDEKLSVYGLPQGVLDVRGKAKWDAWNSLKGKSKEDAMSEYIVKVEELRNKYN
ncbi:unnamed protein product [Candidula unifasciata]|uniref:Acyl-CoA-binding protein n=1 Tax=Candidula unifasciata TaxID=100452 RepID=A0A8S3YCP5_9EUPU|nr:unnamed protein product [Candidula unifasciata]